MNSPRNNRGMSLAELMVAIMLLAICILTVLGLSLAVVRVDSKAAETSAGSVVADTLLQEVVAQVKADSPPGTKDSFWNNDHEVWAQGSRVNNGPEFSYWISAVTVTTTGGDSLGSADLQNRLKKVDVRVRWFNDGSSEQSGRQGYGELEATISQLVPEAQTE